MQLVIKIVWKAKDIRDIINALDHLENANATILEIHGEP